MPTQKIDPKVIFASNAPAIDNPPVFSDKTKGWDVSRANDGRPTIKEMNKVQQDTDLKILWLNENSVTPYDESIDYPDGAVAIKDGSFKQFVSGAWVEFLDGFANKDEVKRGIANRYDSSLTYNSGERVVLTSGDIVKSTIDGNTNDPNVDMTGWGREKNNGVIFLYADALGLVKWDDIDKKPPYTSSEYSDAYNNGVRIARAIKEANIAGFSEVVLETGNYPVLYPNESGSTSNSTMLLTGAIFLDGVKNMTVNLGQSTLFVLFDSANKHQYNLSPSSFAAWRLAGAVITVTNCRGITLKNGRLYGDQYKRAWLSGEAGTEQTYGIKCSRNNRNFRFENIKFTGFRGDGIQGLPRGSVTIASTELQTWTKGGLDAITGLPNTQVGAYRSAKISLASAEIIDQKIQVMGWSTRKISFRSTYLDTYFFDSVGNVISIQKTQQAADITVPLNAVSVQFVAYDDERTTETVTYASLDFGITLGSGMSYGFYVDQDCEFYENMRGGISNLGCGLKVFGARFRDSGRLSKLGFPAYSSTTQYGINLEDTYINDLYIDSILIDNVPIPVITNTRNFTLKSSIIKNSYYSAVGILGSNFVNVFGNTFENIGCYDRPISGGYAGIEYIGNSTDMFEADIRIQDNTCLYTNIGLDVSGNKKVVLSVSGNTVYRGRFTVIGNGGNTRVSDNTIIEVAGTGAIHRGCFVVNCCVNGNLISGVPFGVQLSPSAAVYSNLSGFSAANNTLVVESNLTIAEPSVPDSTLYLSGNYNAGVNNPKHTCRIMAKIREDESWNSSLDTIVFNDSEFSNIMVSLEGTSSSRLYTKVKLGFYNCRFSNTELTNQIRNTYDGGIPEVVFDGCVFDVSTLTDLLGNTYNTPIIFNFMNCTFTSDVQRNFRFTIATGIQGRFINCSFNRVINTGSLIVLDKTASITFDPPSLAAAGTTGDSVTTTVPLSGAVVGDNVIAAFSRYNAGVRVYPVVSAVDTVTVEFRNISSTPIDLLSGTLTVKLI